ncbi:MAG: DinB family protein [Sphingomonadaceae bacterium]
MPACEDLVLMAAYNADMNRTVYAAAATLPHAELVADRQAFFGSLHNTLSHIVVADIVWLQRFRQHPAAWPALTAMGEFQIPTGLAERIADDLPALAQLRTRLDAIISAWAAQLQPADLQQPFTFHRMNGEQQRKHFGSVLLHFFNHQTHHRGQASTLLFQQGVDIGVTDLLAWVPPYAD